jgi:hypothetical protein
VARGAVAGGCRTAACRGGGVGVRRWAAGRLLARGIERRRAAGRAWLAGGGTNPGAFFGRAPAGMETATRSRCMLGTTETPPRHRTRYPGRSCV